MTVKLSKKRVLWALAHMASWESNRLSIGFVGKLEWGGVSLVFSDITS